MTDRLAATDLRILAPRARLLGPGDDDALQNVDTTELPNGAECYVISSQAPFRLHRNDSTTPPDGVNVIQPASGPGRWFIETGTGSGIQIENETGTLSPIRPLLQTRGQHPVDTGTAIQLNDGENDALAYASLSAAVAANPGSQIVLVDQVHVLDASISDPSVTLVFRQGAVLQVPANRTIGVQCDMTSGGLIQPANGVTVSHTAPVMLPDTAQGWDVSLGGTVSLTDAVAAHVTPKQFGAVGDGVADDTVPVQAALASGVGNIFVTAGNYLAVNVVPNTNVTIFGEESALMTLPVLASGDGSPIIRIITDDVNIRDLAFNGQRSLQPNDGFADAFATGPLGTGRSYRAAVLVYDTNDTGRVYNRISIQNCSFTECYGAAVATMNTQELTFTGNRAFRSNFEALFAYGNQAPDVFAAGLIVSGNTVEDLDSGDPAIAPDGMVVHAYTEFLIDDNRISSVQRCAVKLEVCEGGTVSDNVCTTNVLDGFGAIGMQATTEAVDIIGNTIRHFSSGIGWSGSLAGQTCKKINCIGNLIDDTFGPTLGDAFRFGTTADACEDLNISGNICTNVSRVGAFVFGQWTRLNIANNIFVSTSGASGSGIFWDVSVGNWSKITADGNTVDCQGSSQGFFIGRSGGAAVIDDAVITGNSLRNGNAAFSSFSDSLGLIQSGVFDGNSGDGFVLIASAAGTGPFYGSNSFKGFGSSASAYRLITTDAQQLVQVDQLVGINIPGAARTVVLPAINTFMYGQIFEIKDVRGDAGITNITVIPSFGLIDGAPNAVINTNFGFKRFFSDAANWFTA